METFLRCSSGMWIVTSSPSASTSLACSRICDGYPWEDGNETSRLGWTKRCIRYLPFALDASFAASSGRWLEYLIHGANISSLARFLSAHRSTVQAPEPDPNTVSPRSSQSSYSLGSGRDRSSLPINGKLRLSIKFVSQWTGFHVAIEHVGEARIVLLLLARWLGARRIEYFKQWAY